MNLGDEVLRNIRKIIRAIDLHSKKLGINYGLTGSQALLMRELMHAGGPLTVSVLASRISLSAATVTGILNRLEGKKLVFRERDPKDRRRVFVALSEEGQELIMGLPSLLQEQFLRRFENLEDWEKTGILSILQKVASLMDAEEIDAAPMLTPGALLTQEANP